MQPTYNVSLKRHFKDDTYVHGLYYIISTKGFTKLFWCLTFLIMLLLTLWSCIISVRNYATFDVSTSIVYDLDKNRTFPSITFCNQYGLSKSRINTSLTALLFYTALMSRNMIHYAAEMSQNLRLCHVNGGSPDEDNTVQNFERYFGRDSFNTLKKCWFNNVEFNCNGTFGNHVLEDGFCFTLNMASAETGVLSFKDLNNVMYGLDKDALSQRNIHFESIDSSKGVRLLMDVGQYDHCDGSKTYGGAGFQVIIHESFDLKPSTSLMPSLTLMPGYYANVRLKTTIFKRQTSHLGYCSLPTYSFTGKNFVYSKMFCIEKCLLKLIVLNCGCIFNMYPELKEIYWSQVGQINITGVPNCETAQRGCIKDQQFKTLLSDNTVAQCPDCIQPCDEKKYEILVSYRKFPSKNELEYFSKHIERASSVDETRKNFLIANFYFESMTSLHVLETQAFTVKDMFIYIGNAISLFLGMSFISFHEFFHLIFQIIYEKSKRLMQMWLQQRRKTKIYRIGRKNARTKVSKTKRRVMEKSNVKNEGKITVSTRQPNRQVNLTNSGRQEEFVHHRHVNVNGPAKGKQFVVENVNHHIETVNVNEHIESEIVNKHIESEIVNEHSETEAELIKKESENKTVL